jgi:deoxyribose-phosphate aldolase
MIYKLENYLDSTYLKTPKQSKLTKVENQKIIINLVNEAIVNQFKLIMIFPSEVKWVKEVITKEKSKVLIGTVISFPEGTNTIEEKLSEMLQAIHNGADELDVVINYEAFKNGDKNLIQKEVLLLSQFALKNQKTIKFIIETAALNNKQITQVSALIKNTITSNFKENEFEKVFIKSSTGIFNTPQNLPNGATEEAIIIMLENGSPLPIKASGGIKNKQDANFFLKLGVKRLGTSSALAIINNENTNGIY